MISSDSKNINLQFMESSNTQGAPFKAIGICVFQAAIEQTSMKGLASRSHWALRATSAREILPDI